VLQVRPAWALGEQVHAGRQHAGRPVAEQRHVLQVRPAWALGERVHGRPATASITVAAAALIAVTATVATAATAIAPITIAAVIRIASRKTSLSHQR
jgi:hypothetical protein